MQQVIVVLVQTFSAMDLFLEEDIMSIVKQCGYKKVVNWSVEDYSEQLIGYLGDHLKLNIKVENDENSAQLKFFVKCTPRFDKWKAKYLRELNFHLKEYIMLSRLFKEFETLNVTMKWRPKLYFTNEIVFVFEDAAESDYKMPCHLRTLFYDELMATVESLARFHAQSFIYENKKSVELGKPYRIWDEYSEYLQEPITGQDWRDTGRNAVIDYLEVYSKHRFRPNFRASIEVVIPKLFSGALALMKPSSKYRNTVVHRDVWTNNILLKILGNGRLHALLVDYQTVLYCPPMVDLASMVFMNTTADFRKHYTEKILEVYFNILTIELGLNGLDVNNFLDKPSLVSSYEESILFGLTQACLIVPISTMTPKRRDAIFRDSEKGRIANVVSRSKDFIQVAAEDNRYRERVSELFDEIVERYVCNQNDKNSVTYMSRDT